MLYPYCVKGKCTVGINLFLACFNSKHHTTRMMRKLERYTVEIRDLSQLVEISQVLKLLSFQKRSIFTVMITWQRH